MTTPYYTKGPAVFRRPLGGAMGFRVCVCDPDIDGAAEEIAQALSAAEAREWNYDLASAPQGEHVEVSYRDSEGDPYVAIVQAPLWDWHDVYAWRHSAAPAALPVSGNTPPASET